MQPQEFSLYRAPLQALKKVSGRLQRLLRSATTSVKGSPRPSRLLIVEDEAAVCFAMSEYFGQHGFKVDTTSELSEAVTLIENGHYEVIIQDLRLGVMQQYAGLDLIKLVHSRSPQTRVVVLTAYGSSEVEAQARSLGANAFLRKPKPLSQVAQVVQGLIESPHARTR